MTPTGNNELDQVNYSRPNRWRRRVVQGVFAIALLIVGMIAGAMWSERRLSRRPADVSPPASVKEPSPMPAAARPDEAIEVVLTPEAVQRAGIKTAAVRSESVTSAITVPATVMSNAYRDTKVNALVGGIVRRVGAELGSSVKRGQSLAVIFSAELADAQMKYLSMLAMLQADHQKLERTDKLVKLGATSRQELEEVTAVHASRETEVAAARQRLLLLGLSAADVSRLTDAAHIVSDVTVPSPADGVVIGRGVNQGQVVAAGQELFTVTDLSTVWVIGDLYEKDFPSVRVGTSATVTIAAAPNTVIHGRVAYIDPRVDPATRTAKVRVEVPNRNAELRLGMYVTLRFQTAEARRGLLVPSDAVQSIGERTVVYVVTNEEEGRFVERPVKLGQSAGDAVQVIEGLKPGEKVVTVGSFFLRAEAARSRS
jgi:RND family efflux transporter MFP subunit